MIRLWGKAKPSRKQAEQDRLDAAVIARYRHPLAIIDATSGEMAALGANGFTLAPQVIEQRLHAIRSALFAAAEVKHQ